MGHAQKLILWSLIFLASVGEARWRAVAERSGFFGKISAAANYSPTEYQELEMGLGTYAIGSANYAQLNAAYRYGHWLIPWDTWLWKPVQVGIFAIYSLDNQHFFTQSPSKYPGANYYDETAYRYGLELGSALAFSSPGFEVGYRLRVLDNGLVAIYNNAHRDLQYYLSSAVEFRYHF